MSDSPGRKPAAAAAAGGGVAALAKRWEAASSSSSGNTSAGPSRSNSLAVALGTARSQAQATTLASEPVAEALDNGAQTPKNRNDSSSSDADSSAEAWSDVLGSAPLVATSPSDAPTTPVLDPSIGAKSLTEPGTTIINPFGTAMPTPGGTKGGETKGNDQDATASFDPKLTSASSDSIRQTASGDNVNTEPMNAASSGTASALGESSTSGVIAPSIGTASSQGSRRQSFESATDMRRGLSTTESSDAAKGSNAPSGDAIVRDSNHFSVVSLGTTDTGVEDTIKNKGQSGPDGQRSAISSISGSGGDAASQNGSSTDSQPSADPDTALIRARVESQSAELKRDPKAWRASIDGAAKIRQSFERKMQERQSSASNGEAVFKRSTLRSVSLGNDVEEDETEPWAGEAAEKVSVANEDMSTTPTLPQRATYPDEGGKRASARSSKASTSALPLSQTGTGQTGPAESDSVDAAVREIDADGTDEDLVDWTFWGEIMSDYAEVARTRPQELSRAIRRGIPPALRGMMWQLMSSSKDEELELIYAYYLKQTSPHEKAIRRDLSRTFPEQEYFADGKGVGQENLFNVIKAYSLYDEECGYCQGMQFVVGPLLLNMPDEEAFSTLARLMKSYDLRGHYIPNMPSLQLRLFQFDRLLEEFLPLLHRHLTRQGVKSSMYAAQWFMTLFSYRFPLELVYRILDSVFAEGIETLFRFSIALLQRNEDKLLNLNFEGAVQFLKDNLFDAYLREDFREETPRAPKMSASGPATGSATTSRYHTADFVADAYQVRITPHQLDTYAAEFEEHVRKANAHRREVDALRLVNRNLAAKVKELEVQLTQVSNEHVDLVKQVVMAKIEKDEIAEELARYKLMYAEAVLSADQEGGRNGRGSSAGLGYMGSAGGSSTRTSRSTGS